MFWVGKILSNEYLFPIDQEYTLKLPLKNQILISVLKLG